MLSGRHGAVARRPVDALLLLIKLTLAINIILERALALSLPLLCLLDAETSGNICVVPFALFAVAVVNRSHERSVTAITSLDKKKYKQMSVNYVTSEIKTPRGPAFGLQAPIWKIT